MQSGKISNIPANIITGFLGVGKTTAILNLLKNKPSNERWAVLVNEFGEIGVDGSLINGLHKEEEGVYIAEVPGGCMCCTAGVPMQVALNQLLKHSKPDRLLIEPTGLGHPIEILKTLTETHYKEALSLQRVITLVDARNLSDSRYTSHETFNQQIEIADLIIGNKQDLYSPSDNKALENYAQKFCRPGTPVQFIEHGQIDPKLLNSPTTAKTSHCCHSHSHHHHTNTSNTPDEIPACGYIKALNSGEGHQSVGWRFNSEIHFSHEKLSRFFSSLKTERMKAVFRTNDGYFGYNLSSGTLSETHLANCPESRIEIIAPQVNKDWETQLLSCRL